MANYIFSYDLNGSHPIHAEMDKHIEECALSRLQAAVPEDRVVAEDEGILRVISDRRPQFRGGQTSQKGAAVLPLGNDSMLRQKLKHAHTQLEAHSMSLLRPKDHPCAEAPSYQRQRRLMALGLLSPVLQRRVAEGSIGEARALALLEDELPLAWKDQAAMLGL